jgi:hypothetical protein
MCYRKEVYGSGGNLTRIFKICENVIGTFVIEPRYRKQVLRVQYL